MSFNLKLKILHILTMKILKRNGDFQNLSLNKIVYRIRKVCNDKKLGKLKHIDPDLIAQKVVVRLYDEISTSEIDELTGQITISMATEHPEYGDVASRVIVSNMHKNTVECFSEVMETLYSNIDIHGNVSHLVSDKFINVVRKYKNELNFELDFDRDYMFDYFGFKTLERSYLTKIHSPSGSTVIERPQHMFMRVAIGIHFDNLDKILETYNYMSQGYFTHATPTLFNAGTPRPQMSSCFLLSSEDSIDGIYKNITDCAKISKWAGGIGFHISDIRSKNSKIRGTNGKSDGIVPMLRVYNSTARYVNQCITPDTIIYTKQGFKQMNELTTNDLVVTKDGSFKKINEIIINQKQENIYHISNFASVDPLKCTKEHDIYTIKLPPNWRNGHSQLKTSLSTGYLKTEFVPTSYLKKGDYMGYPIPTYTEDIEFSEEQCRIYGILLGDGNISKSETSMRYQISLNNFSKSETKQFVLEYLNKNDIHYWISNDCEICFTYSLSVDKVGITIDMLYDQNKHKYLDERFLHLPENKLCMLLKGFLETGGCVTRAGIFYGSTDKNLIYSIKYLFLRLGILTSCQTVDRIGQTMNFNKHNNPIISRKIYYQLRIPKVQLLKDLNIFANFVPSIRVNFFEWNNILFSRITSIDTIHYTGDVYDLNIEDNHNYLTDMGLVHNSGRRNGSFAAYIEPWHADIFEFLDLKKNHGDEEQRARDLFYALWIPDLFMKCVDEDLDWYLMCPDQCPNLNETYSKEFNTLYQKYIDEGKFIKKIKARDLWAKIVTSQTETGTPYMLYKDACNEKSNQKNLGTIKSSNLCSEIIEYTSPSETACCNLASIALPKFIKNVTKKFSLDNYDFEELHKISKIAIKNLDNVIDENYYPLPEAQISNFKHRPIGLGIQGLADTYMKLRIPFESDEATTLNKKIFEVIEYAALEASCELAQEKGTYKTYEGSPLSKGLFQHNLWNIDESTLTLDWESLRQKILAHGVRNSLLTALMPTASTAQILGNSECFEPYQSNIFMRRTISGEFPIINKFLVNDLMKLNLWNKIMRDELVRQNGSIQHIPGIPDDVKQLYKTVWEISQKSIINQSADRGPFIDQSQSLNLFLAEPTYRKITSMQFYAWKKGLKTGQYYLRTKAAREAVQVTLEVKQQQQQPENPTEDCTDDVCVMCSG